jgi:hypothetical protein
VSVQSPTRRRTWHGNKNNALDNKESALRARQRSDLIATYRASEIPTTKYKALIRLFVVAIWAVMLGLTVLAVLGTLGGFDWLPEPVILNLVVVILVITYIVLHLLASGYRAFKDVVLIQCGGN